ncbi:MAG: SUMF1/EgtB/PvdO family nonheme iron enzyme [Rhodospirillaceae bacterium]|nr:SUMF1/EgtB/PvdO family nonheme iron enzyme [Rhodospirillaceae bacterium]
MKLFCMALVFGLWGLSVCASAQEVGDFIQDDPRAPEMVILPPVAGRVVAMARTETTFAQWDACVDAGACSVITDDHGWGRGRRPVINVSWHDAKIYTHWVSKLTGQVCRLPSGAEWDVAAGAGGKQAYWWGDSMKSGMARCRGCNPGVSDYGTMPVASYPPNPFGLFDMNGNLWEWVEDCAVTKPPGQCSARLTRGGAWYYFSNQSKHAAKAPRPPAERSFTVGFRVVCER